MLCPPGDGDVGAPGANVLAQLALLPQVAALTVKPVIPTDPNARIARIMANTVTLLYCCIYSSRTSESFKALASFDSLSTVLMN